MKQRPVRPRDAGTLVLVARHAGGVPGRARLLMGRRAPESSFIPGAYVFPGGAVDRGDRCPGTARPLSRAVAASLPGDPRRAQGFAMAAVRETHEETGLALDGGAGAGEAGFTPALDMVGFIGRAITPTPSPIRFDTCFFAADARHASGVLGGNGELLDLRWVMIGEAIQLASLRITRRILNSIAALLADGREPGPGFCPQPPFYTLRNGEWTVRGG